MRLLTFSPPGDQASRVGALRDADRRVVDIGRSAAELGLETPFDSRDMISVISAGQPGLDVIRTIVNHASTDFLLADVQVNAPIPRPRKNIFCVGWNYQDHFEEGAKIRPHVKEMPAFPTFFTKAPTTVIGPFDPIPFFGGLSAQLDWEVELAVVVGRAGRDIPEANAMEYVFGYTVLNDVTWRDVQRRHGQQWFKGKSIDGTCPMGPWITSADEIDPESLDLSSRVNGESKQTSNTRHMYFKIPRIIAELSHGLTLEPGDVIATGTPPGVGHARTPPEFMKPGDVLETEVAGLGLLRNLIATAA